MDTTTVAHLEKTLKEQIDKLNAMTCSRIIDNFKRTLLMKPGTFLVKIRDKTTLKEDDIIIYQRDNKNSPFIFGLYKPNSDKFQNKDIFQFIPSKKYDEEQSSSFEIARSMDSTNLPVQNPEDELMLVEFKYLNQLKLYLQTSYDISDYRDKNNKKYVPIIMSLIQGNYIGVGMYFDDPSDRNFFTTNRKYYIFINEKQYNENNSNSNQFIKNNYHMVTSIQ